MKVATTKIEPKPWTGVQGPTMESPPAIPVIILGILIIAIQAGLHSWRVNLITPPIGSRTYPQEVFDILLVPSAHLTGFAGSGARLVFRILRLTVSSPLVITFCDRYVRNPLNESRYAFWKGSARQADLYLNVP